MNTKKIWMVRAGEGAYRFDDFKESSVVAIGWRLLGNLAEYKDKNSIIKKMREI